MRGAVHIVWILAIEIYEFANHKLPKIRKDRSILLKNFCALLQMVPDNGFRSGLRLVVVQLAFVLLVD